MRKWLNILILCLICSLTACIGEPEQITHKVIVYMAARNNLSPFADKDFNEIRSAMGTIPGNAFVLVYIQRRNTDAELYRITRNKCTLEVTYPSDESACDSVVFCNRLSKIERQYPTSHTGLILWSHGSGWIPPTGSKPHKAAAIHPKENAFGRDDARDSLQLSIFAIQRGCEQLNQPLDYIFFDACHMQSIEVAYQLRHCTKAILATPAEMPGEGAPYDKILGSLCQMDIEGIGKTVYDTYNNEEDGIVLSLLSTGNLERVAAQIRETVITYFGNQATPDLGYPYLYTQQYSLYEKETGYFPDFYDLTSVFHRLQDTAMCIQPDEVVSKRWLTKRWYSANMGNRYQKVIDPDHSCGVSAFIPMAHYRAEYLDYFHRFDWYQAAGWNETGW